MLVIIVLNIWEFGKYNIFSCYDTVLMEAQLTFFTVV